MPEPMDPSRLPRLKPKTSRRPRVSLGTALLLVALVGLSWGLFVVSERAHKAELEAEARVREAEAHAAEATVWRNRFCWRFFDDPEAAVADGLLDKNDLLEQLWQTCEPQRTARRGTLLIFGRNPEEMVHPGFDAYPQADLYHPFICIADIDLPQPQIFKVPFDPNYRIVEVKLAGSVLSVTLTRRGVDLNWTVSTKLPRPGSGVNYLPQLAALDRQMNGLDGKYCIQMPQAPIIDPFAINPINEPETDDTHSESHPQSSTNEFHSAPEF